MRFALRYWTRRSASTVALSCPTDYEPLCQAATRLRHWAVEHEHPIYGEAFLRLHPTTPAVLHLPIGLEDDTVQPPLRVGRIDHGPVVAAYAVEPPDSRSVAQSLIALLKDECIVTGPAEYHFDPSVGRTDGIVVIPVLEHPADKPAFISIRGAISG